MTTTPVVIVLKRSSLDSDRPSGVIIEYGELALCRGSGDPGLYFEDNAGNIVKIGPPGYGSIAPNTNYVGSSGNTLGEPWTDTSGAHQYYRIWNGITWAKVGAGFADTTTLASGAILASGALLASGAYLASGAIQASGSILSSGSLLASGAYLASGSIQASGAILASGALLASGAYLASGAIMASGSIQASGAILASGAVEAYTSNLASGAILASGAVEAYTSNLASGSVQASGAIIASGAYQVSTIVSSGLPDPSTITSGVLYLQLEASGIYGSGLYVRAGADWYFV